MTQARTLDSSGWRVTMLWEDCTLICDTVSAWASNLWGLGIEFNYVDNNSISHTYIMKLNKNSEHQSLRHLPGWGTHWCARSLMHPDPMGREPGSSAFRISPHHVPKVSPMCVFTWMVLICILHKTVIVSIAFSWVLLFYSSKLWYLGRGRGL